MATHRVGGVSACIAMLAGVTAARAQGHPGAEQLFRDGRAALAAGNTAEACDLFRRSNELEPRVGTLLNLGDCREQLGQTATAWAVFVEASTLASQSNDGRREEAGRRAAALEAQLAYLTIEAPSLAGLVVTRGGAEVKPAELGVALPVDPGEQVVEARAKGHQTWSERILIVPAKRLTVAIPMLGVDHTAPVQENAQRDTPVAPTNEATGPRRFGLGVAAGASSHDELYGGVRGYGEMALAHRFAVRGTAQVLYTSYRTDSDYDRKVFAPSLGVDAVFRHRQLAFAAGVGVVLDIERDVFTDATGSTSMTESAPHFLLRASPLIVQLGPVEAGVHANFVINDGIIAIGMLGVDYVAW